MYNKLSIPDQWKVAKTVPVFKNKGEKKDIENYRPIANLCSSSKIFEKLILKRILEIQDANNCDITCENQHGFKHKRSTSTLSAKLQSLIARALDEGEHVLIASLDLSAAFDIVNVDLLVRRLKIIGLPDDVVALIRVWLENRSYYVSINGVDSVLFDLLLGTVQGSILGPVLYAIFVSPLFDLEGLDAFADDKFILRTNHEKGALVSNMEKSLETITKWLTQSGLKVNQTKTEICSFYKNDTSPVTVKIGEASIISKKSINILGVIFDSNLKWSEHINSAIYKANKSLNAIKLIMKYFNTNELIQLLTSNYYSILYYNSEIWHTHSLSNNLKHSLFVASANALRVCLHYPNREISYFQLHLITNRATPAMYLNYKLSLMLFKVINENIPLDEWTHLNFSQTLTSRQTNFICNKNNVLKVGLNALTNRFHAINNKIPLEWLNLNINSFKVKCKNLFLTF